MLTITDDTFEDDSTEIDLRYRLKRLQGIVCYLLCRNEELRAAVHELEIFQLRIRTQGDE